MTTETLHRVLRLPAHVPAYAWLIGVWLLVMISVPILGWTGGVGARDAGVTLSVAAQLIAVMALLATRWGAKRTLVVAALLIGATWVVEFLGHTTGLPFGQYRYTNVLQPQLGGVPVIVPMAWAMMLPAAWAVATVLRADTSRWRFALVSGLALAAWDLFLDPQMVSWGYWEWQQAGAYFGIPLLNFVGWSLTAAAVTALIRPRDIPVLPLLVIYTATCLLQFTGQLVFWSMPGPAITGGVVMGGLAMLAWRRTRVMS